jgi:mRNA-degrading endonuclease RelE of RelBE toxin-antitoxin system
MPSEPAEPVRVEYTLEFKRNLRALAKKYRHIRSDVQPVIDQLRAGEIIGDQVPRTRYTIFKVRVRNSDIRKGKRSGYRLILSSQDTDERYPCDDLFQVGPGGRLGRTDSAHSDQI